MTGARATQSGAEQGSDIVTRFCRAAENRNDAELRLTLAHDVELTSPVSERMVFRGRDDVTFLLATVFASVAAIRWIDIVGERTRRVAFAEARLGPFPLTDALVIELDHDGMIGRLQPHIRPWAALTTLGLVLGAQLILRPGILVRGMRRTPPVRHD